MRHSKSIAAGAIVAGLGLAATLLLAGPVLAGDRGSGKGNLLSATLTGSVEVPPGDPNASGKAVIRLEPGSDTICFKESWSGLTSVTASHIHLGGTGVAGPVVVAFFTSAVPNTISTVGGCVHNVDPALIKAIHDDPSGYYVNVHDAAFPAGALRGQLRPGKHGGDNDNDKD